MAMKNIALFASGEGTNAENLFRIIKEIILKSYSKHN
jgi:hypothetical protein